MLSILILAWVGIVFFCYLYSFYFVQSSGLFFHLTQFARQYGYFSLWHPYSLKALASIGLACWIAWITVKCGNYLVLKIVPESELSPLERRIFSAGLGVGSVALVTFGFGLLGLWYVNVFWAALIAATAVALPRKRPRWNWQNASFSLLPLKVWWSQMMVGLLVIIALMFLVGDLAPEIFFDSLHYHLAIPNLYLLNHRIYDVPYFAFSSFIMTVQMYWGFAVTVGNEITVKLLHGAAAVLIFFSFIAFERRYLSQGAGLIGAVLCFSMPLVGLNVRSAGIDVMWSAFQFLSVFALARALESNHDTSVRQRWIVLTGILTGLAASCKYTGLPAIPIAGGVIAWNGTRERKGWNIVSKELGWFLICSVLVVSPYLLRNVVFHHNPFYPFAGTFWGVPRISAQNWHNIARDTGSRSLIENFSSSRSILQLMFQPWLISMPSNLLDNHLGPVLLALLPLIILIRPPNRASAMLTGYGLVLGMVWLLTSTYARYGMPAFVMLSLVLANCLLNVRIESSVRRAVLVFCIAGAGLILYISLVASTYSQSWLVLGGIVSEREYLKEEHTSYPTPSYEATDWMNRNLPPGSKVMFTGDSRSYYSRVALVPSSVYDTQPIVAASREARNGAEMASRLREQGVTHVFVNAAEALRTQSYGLFSWDPESWAVLEDFWRNHLRLVWSDASKALFVYELRSDIDAGLPPPPNPFKHWKPGS